MRERRNTSSITLRGTSAAAESPIRNRSAHAVNGRQNSTLTPTTKTIITAIAISTFARSPASLAAATKAPMPGSANWWLLTESASDAVRKNQPPPKLIMPFQTSGIIPLGTSTRQNRCQRDNRSSRDASSSSRGWLISE